MVHVKPKGQVWEKQKRFCDEYLLCLNATQAAIKAGYSISGAKQIGSRFLTYPYIQEYLEELKRELAANLPSDYERIYGALNDIAFTDIRAFYDKNGNIIPIHQLSDAAAMSIASIEVTEEKTGRKGVKTIIKKIKLIDKLGAYDRMNRMKGYYAPEKSEISGPGGGAIPISEHKVIFTDYSQDE